MHRTQRVQKVNVVLATIVLASCAHDPAPKASTAAGAQAERAPSDRFTKEEINGAVRAHQAEVNACYDRGLAKSQDMRGRIIVRFDVGSSGNVVFQQIVESKLEPASQVEANAEVERCILDTVHTWTFPRPTGKEKVIVIYPFMLEHEDRT